MAGEELPLLLRDLCARLPYGVIVRGVFIHYNKNDDKIRYEEIDNKLDYRHLNRYESLKPYLRPMSSMTEEELKWYYNKLTTIEESRIRRQKHIEELNDWLNAHHFDYRGLIPMGLALEATEGMYNS